jgi:ABC-2 type transport system permease protein
MTAIAETRPIAAPHEVSGHWIITFLALMQRDARVLRREFMTFIVRTAMQPFLFVFVFAYVQPKIGIGQTGFGDVLIPGLVAQSVIFQGIQAVALPLAVEFSSTREIEDRVLAPLPVWGVAMEKIVFAALQALLAAAVVFPLVYIIPAKRPQLDINWPILISVLIVGSIISASLGLSIGTTVNPRQIGLVFGIIVIPMSFLGAVFYPWAQLHSIRWLQVVTLVNPLVYMSEGLRAALTPRFGHMQTAFIYLGLLITAASFTWYGVRGFLRRVLS